MAYCVDKTIRMAEPVGTWAKHKACASNAVADNQHGFAIRSLPSNPIALRTTQSVHKGIDAPVMACADTALIVEVKRTKGNRAWSYPSKKVKPSKEFEQACVRARSSGSVTLVDHASKPSPRLAVELDALASVKGVATVEAKAYRDVNPATPHIRTDAIKAIGGKANALRSMVSPSKILSDKAAQKKANASAVPLQLDAMMKKYHELGLSIAKKEGKGQDATNLLKCREALVSRIRVMIDHCTDNGLLEVKPQNPKHAQGVLISFEGN